MFADLTAAQKEVNPTVRLQSQTYAEFKKIIHKFVEDTVPEDEGVSEGINRFLKYASPRTLLRFLIARDFTLAKSVEMLQNSIVRRWPLSL